MSLANEQFAGLKFLFSYLFVVACLLVASMTIPRIAFADSSSQSGCIYSESTKALEVKKTLTMYPLYATPGTKTGPQVAFCERFFDEFRSQKQIEYMEPNLCTNDLKDPLLDRFNNCFNYDQPNSRPFDSRFYGIWELGDRNVKLYQQTDFEPSELIYSEPDSTQAGNKSPPGFSLVDSKNCEITSFVPAVQSSEESSNIQKKNYSALIRYAREVYIFSLRDNRAINETSPHYFLRLFRHTQGSGFRYICSWSSSQN